MISHTSHSDVTPSGRLEVYSEIRRSDPCRQSSSPLLAVEDHAFALGCLLREPSFDATFDWYSVAEWLILSAGVKSVSIVTNGLDEGDSMCPNPYEEERGRAASRVATELTRLLFVWGAVDRVMALTLKDEEDMGNEGLPRRFSKHIGSRCASLPHQTCAAQNLLLYLDSHESCSFRRVSNASKKLSECVVSQGTLAATQVRNALSHGSIPWPEIDDRSAELGTRIGRMACRVLLFAVQNVMCNAVSPVAQTSEWSDENGHYELVPVKDLLPSAHLAKKPHPL